MYLMCRIPGRLSAFGNAISSGLESIWTERSTLETAGGVPPKFEGGNSS